MALTHNTKLLTLYCNENRLARLDISYNKEIRQLCCSYNMLTTLDISNNLFLVNLECNDNPDLTKLYVKKEQEILSYIFYRNNPMEIVYK